MLIQADLSRLRKTNREGGAVILAKVIVEQGCRRCPDGLCDASEQ
jgi:hypothetical protein